MGHTLRKWPQKKQMSSQHLKGQLQEKYMDPQKKKNAGE